MQKSIINSCMLIYLKLYKRPGHMSTYHATFFIKSWHYCMQCYSCGTRFYFYKIVCNIILHATILGMGTKVQLILAIASNIAHNIVLHVRSHISRLHYYVKRQSSAMSYRSAHVWLCYLHKELWSIGIWSSVGHG